MKFYIETYGCQMNISDSELISSILCEAGYTPALEIDDADVLLFNTCSVRQHAEDRVLGRISCEKVRKLSNPKLKIVVLGCMAQRMGKTLHEMNLGIDLVVGVDQYKLLPTLLSQSGSAVSTSLDTREVYHEYQPRHQNSYNAFVTVMRGCDNFCTYCIVPHVRGRERSRPNVDIKKEVNLALANGHRDITLLGQNVNSYKHADYSFASLLKDLASSDEKFRLRFITSHPKDLSDELIEVMATQPNVCKHIHLPLQSGDSETLSKMNRKYSYEHYYRLIEKLRAAMPQVGITTDLIAGFPGETVVQFESTLDAMRQIRFDYAFCFKYSNRDGTEAARYMNQIPEATRLSRLQKMIDLQRDISLEKFRAHIGKEVEIYVESFSRKSNKQVSGKTDDFKIAVVSGDQESLGRFVKATVRDATAGTLICD